jgi:two-component system osmolarity sensor histidine kinase EnvZ
VTLRADPDLLGKALANLVRNARQAAETVVVAWRRGERGVEIEVRDDGPGVPANERETIFEPFRTGRAGGTGLGLAIARNAIAIQGGTIAVDGAPEGGARFTIRLRSGEDT